MKTKAIKRCIDNSPNVRDALAAQEELYAIEIDMASAQTDAEGHCMIADQRVAALEKELANKVFVDEQMVMGIRDTLQYLIDIQNGCPLPKYQEMFDRANASANQLIECLGNKLKES